MNHLNSVIVEGNLVADPVMNFTPKGTPVCSFRIASDRQYKVNGETAKEVSFFSVEAWARQGEAVAEYKVKGDKVRVVGRLCQDRWSDLEGNSHSRIKIVAEHVEFVGAPRRRVEETVEA